MNCHPTGILIILSVCALVSSNPERPIDCRKFVFAPLCRGVAAKRGNSGDAQISPAIYVNAKNFKELLKNLDWEMRIPRDYDEDDSEDPFKNFKEERDEKNYKLLQERKKIKGSQSGNNFASPVKQEYENL